MDVAAFVQSLFVLLSLAVWPLLILGFLRVLWFAWIGPRRLSEIERKVDVLTSSVENLPCRYSATSSSGESSRPTAALVGVLVLWGSTEAAAGEPLEEPEGLRPVREGPADDY